MYVGKLVFAQVMEHLPLHTFRRIVARYAGEHKVKSFSCLDQYLSMAFAQLTFRESLRDIEACLRAQSSKLYHLGIRSTVARNTLANAGCGAEPGQGDPAGRRHKKLPWPALKRTAVTYIVVAPQQAAIAEALRLVRHLRARPAVDGAMDERC